MCKSKAKAAKPWPLTLFKDSSAFSAASPAPSRADSAHGTSVAASAQAASLETRLSYRI